MSQVSRKGTGFLTSEEVQAMIGDDEEEEANVRFDHTAQEQGRVWTFKHLRGT